MAASYEIWRHRFALLTLALICVDAQATNGYFTHGIGVKNKAMAGAGGAMPEEAAAVAINPAAAVLVGDRFEMSMSIFSPRRSYQTSASVVNGKRGAFTVDPARVKSRNRYFAIPYLGRSWSLDNESAATVLFYGRGGMNTEFSSGSATFDTEGTGQVGTLPGTFGAGSAGVDLSQAFADLAYARRTGKLDWGVSLVLAAQTLEVRGLAQFERLTETYARSNGTISPRNLTNNGHDLAFGYGIKAGVIWRHSGRFAVAASYGSRMAMQPFDQYADLFADGGEFDIPANARIGLSWRATSRLILHFDAEQVRFSGIASVGNSARQIRQCPTAGLGGTRVTSCLGGRRGAGFGWRDMTIYKFGTQYNPPIAPHWTLRAGFSRSQQPIASRETLLNILAPAVIEKHFTIGANKTLRDGRELSFAAMYAPTHAVSGPNAFDTTQVITLEMHQIEFEIGISF